MTKALQAIFVISIIFLFNPISANNTLSPIKITKGNLAQIPIAINFFAANSNEEQDLSKNIVSIINNDLNISQIFAPISSNLFIEAKQGTTHIPLFTTWSQINANILINGEISTLNSTEFKVDVIIWDIFTAKEIHRLSFTFPLQLWRSTAHKISDQIYQHITGNKGIFDTKIVYVSETQSYDKKIKKIAIMDYDGANHSYITNGKNHVITPVFSPNNNQILYVSYHNKIPTVRIMILILEKIKH
ncbi:tolB amino-terminal domain protein [Orientia chuto str. Dubai]|uniref:TolB amino-terminal domain protein n=1 Tax=Orientia chuto str. Dubai TaxID=1359168 RepID=A0A0F3MLL3_9RICK|nr:tolB amino-terminal domain protein [Orientia chuto str. Dubai]